MNRGAEASAAGPGPSSAPAQGPFPAWGPSSAAPGPGPVPAHPPGHRHPPVPPSPRPDRPPPLHRRLAAPTAALAAVAGAFIYVGAVDPGEPGHYPVCPLLQLTGIYCPGCGGLRSAHAFVHGELGTAFGANALAVAGYLLFAVLWAFWLVRAVRARPVRITLGPAWWWGLGAVLAVFTVVRNLPFGSGLAP
ncbi:hypothetical protein DDQ41_02830 [Streptomyces spongiicola]|uniref:DUF2752 domain-containing protein n=1 Tax=Streptomyces spongiicola TaxID=1690221 RepID=A0ABN5KET9_9ACTN|nr:DUF2752 domain-containing protein [Streptomyces spongiicola]AWK08045.1 hypothetical protein DDQ41_02830 [Streptomyces spongiicola]